MAVQADATGQAATAGRNWYARSPDEVTAALASTGRGADRCPGG